MSISFNEKDHNLIRIRRESKLFNLTTKNEYRIYGLRQEENPPVLISAQESLVTEQNEKILVGFLKHNHIFTEMEDCDSSDKKIYIGLRYDLRNNVLLAASVIQTIIYFCEGRLDLQADYVVGNGRVIPHFENNPLKNQEKAKKEVDNG